LAPEDAFDRAYGQMGTSRGRPSSQAPLPLYKNKNNQDGTMTKPKKTQGQCFSSNF